MTKDDWASTSALRDFTAVDWFSNQTCRIDSLDSLSRKLSWAIEAEAQASRETAEYRLVRLVAPLGVAFVLMLGVVLHAMRTLWAYEVAAEARVASLSEVSTQAILLGSIKRRNFSDMV